MATTCGGWDEVHRVLLLALHEEALVESCQEHPTFVLLMGEDGEEGICGCTLANGDAVDLVELRGAHEVAVFLTEHVVFFVIRDLEAEYHARTFPD